MKQLFGIFCCLLFVACAQSEEPKGGARAAKISAQAGESCGGESGGAVCAKGLFCKTAEGECAAAGSCEAKPEICTMIYAPVCGCDGKTYSSDCSAFGQGISIAHHGECRKP